MIVNRNLFLNVAVFKKINKNKAPVKNNAGEWHSAANQAQAMVIIALILLLAVYPFSNNLNSNARAKEIFTKARAKFGFHELKPIDRIVGLEKYKINRESKIKIEFTFLRLKTKNKKAYENDWKKACP
ncbi:MAG: hypothetical protein V4591_09375 [Bdellovibrionota bacterium]